MNGDADFELVGTGLKIASIKLSVVVLSEGSRPGVGDCTRVNDPEREPTPKLSARTELDRVLPGVVGVLKPVLNPNVEAEVTPTPGETGESGPNAFIVDTFELVLK